jgi:hypothetical protein
MKKLWTITLLLLCIAGFTQEGDLPREVESAFQGKYTNTRIGDWWVDNQLYYIDFNFRGGSYIIVFDQLGIWKETAEIISEAEIPEALKRYIRTNFPSGKISFCEQVESSEKQKYLRINLIDVGNVERVIRSDTGGNEIVVLDNNPDHQIE